MFARLPAWIEPAPAPAPSLPPPAHTYRVARTIVGPFLGLTGEVYALRPTLPEDRLFLVDAAGAAILDLPRPPLAVLANLMEEGALVPRSEAGRQALREGAAREAAAREVLRAVPVDAITRSPWQPRTAVDVGSEEFAALVDSIQAHGVLEPLLARELASGGVELLARERGPRDDAPRLRRWPTPLVPRVLPFAATSAGSGIRRWRCASASRPICAAKRGASTRWPTRLPPGR
jgi:hypothetical protein